MFNGNPVFAGADNKDGANANAYIRADGYLFSGSVSDSLFLQAIEDAPSGQNSTDAPLFSPATEWSASVNQTGPGTTSETVITRRIRFRKKPGTTKLIFTFWAKRETSQVLGGGGSGGATTEVRLTGTNITDTSASITTTSFTRHTIEADFASADLFNDVDRIVKIEIFAEAEVVAGSAGDFEQNAEIFLDKGLMQLEQAA